MTLPEGENYTMWIDDDELVQSGVSKLVQENAFVHFDKFTDKGGKVTGITTGNGKVFIHMDPDTETARSASAIADDDENLIIHFDMNEKETGYSIMEEISVPSINTCVKNICHYDMGDNLTGVTRIVLPLKIGGFILHYKLKG